MIPTDDSHHFTWNAARYTINVVSNGVHSHNKHAKCIEWRIRQENGNTKWRSLCLEQKKRFRYIDDIVMYSDRFSTTLKKNESLSYRECHKQEQIVSPHTHFVLTLAMVY